MYSPGAYSALSDERDAGPQLHGPLPPVLRLLLRLANALFTVASLALLGYALYLDWGYSRAGGGGGYSPAPAPPSPPPEPTPDPSPEPVPSPADPSSLLLGAHTWALGEASVARFPWFIYLIGGTGAYLFAASLVGASGVRRSSRWRLAVYIAMLSVLILAEAAALLLLFTNNQWRDKIPGDPSGSWEAAQRFIASNEHLVKLGALIVIAVELLALGAASWLHSLQQAAHEAWLDEREEAEARARQVLERTVQQQYAGGANNLWTQRMQSKYGVTQSQVQCDVDAVRQVAALSSDLPSSSTV